MSGTRGERRATSDTAALPVIEEVLPHRGTMLLLDRLLTCDAEGLSAEYTPRSDAWYANADGDMPAWIGIELMAQAIAAEVGLRQRSAGLATKPGVLLGSRHYAASRPVFASGEALRVHATLLYRDAGGLAAYTCRIVIGDEEVASATLTVFEPEDFPTFLQASLP
jgi:predicted hotdog family 3-hydroxylacyl-ACP dehydratase